LSFFFFFEVVSVAQGFVAAEVPADAPPGVVAALPLMSDEPAGEVAWVEPVAEGEEVVCAEAIVAPPIKRRAADAVSAVFLKVILFSCWGATWRALWGPSRST
jgi:hypothetical protein